MIRAPARRACRRRWPRAGSRCSRSAPTRARRAGGRGGGAARLAGDGRAGPRRPAARPPGRARLRTPWLSPGRTAATAPAAPAARAAFPIRLIALDIDGTLVGDDLVLGPRTIAAVRAARERGVRGLARHRPDDDERPALRPDASASSSRSSRYQGALIRALPPPAAIRGSGRILAHRPLRRGRGARGHRLGEDGRARAAPQPPRAVRHPGRRPAGRGLLGVPRRPGRLVADLAGVDPPARSRRSSRSARRPDPRGDRWPTARRRFAGRAEVTISHPRFLEFLAPGVSKAVGVRHLARRAGVPLAQRPRDRRPVQRPRDARRASATARRCRRRPDPVRAAARYVAPPLAEEGAAQLIEQLVLASPGDAARNAARLAAAHDAEPRASPDRRHDRPDRRRRRSRPGRGDRGPPGRRRSSPCPTDTVYGIAVALDTPRRDRGACSRPSDRPPDQGDHAAPRRRGPGAGDRGVAAGRGRARRRRSGRAA